MKKTRTILVVLSAIYIVLTIIFLLNDESLFNNFNLLKLINYLQGWIIAGIVLLAGVIIVGSLYIRSLRKQNGKLEKEYNEIKARLYDIEEERKAEIVSRQAEEESTERKLEAFNQSLKGKNKTGYDTAEDGSDPDRADRNRPSSAGDGNPKP